MKFYVNDVQLNDGDETVLHGTTSFETHYNHEGERNYHMRQVDFVIEIDHTALLEMIDNASQEKNRKYAAGPLSIKVDNLVDSAYWGHSGIREELSGRTRPSR